jgi:hypothetical protein
MLRGFQAVNNTYFDFSPETSARILSASDTSGVAAAHLRYMSSCRRRVQGDANAAESIPRG